jgi:hypothetical protein
MSYSRRSVATPKSQASDNDEGSAVRHEDADTRPDMAESSG